MPTDAKLDFDRGWTEPESEASIENPPQYPYNNITQTESGHSFEMDDTPGRERIRLQHRSGTFTEVHSDGTEVHKVVGDGYEIVANDKNVLIKGVCNITINGDAIVNVKGSKYERIEGDYEQEILGNYTQTVKKKLKILSEDDMRIGANPSFLGKMTLSAGDHVYVDSDLTVDGTISSKSVQAQGRIDAGTGISAGALGFVSTTGGLSIGVPVAVPGQIITSGGVYSSSVTSGLATFGISGSLLHFDVVNQLLFNTHVHPAPTGVTGPTPQQFVKA